MLKQEEPRLPAGRVQTKDQPEATQVVPELNALQAPEWQRYTHPLRQVIKDYGLEASRRTPVTVYGVTGWASLSMDGTTITTSSVSLEKAFHALANDSFHSQPETEKPRLITEAVQKPIPLGLYSDRLGCFYIQTIPLKEAFFERFGLTPGRPITVEIAGRPCELRLSANRNHLRVMPPEMVVAIGEEFSTIAARLGYAGSRDTISGDSTRAFFIGGYDGIIVAPGLTIKPDSTPEQAKLARISYGATLAHEHAHDPRQSPDDPSPFPQRSPAAGSEYDAWKAQERYANRQGAQLEFMLGESKAYTLNPQPKEYSPETRLEILALHYSESAFLLSGLRAAWVENRPIVVSTPSTSLRELAGPEARVSLFYRQDDWAGVLKASTQHDGRSLDVSLDHVVFRGESSHFKASLDSAGLPPELETAVTGAWLKARLSECKKEKISEDLGLTFSLEIQQHSLSSLMQDLIQREPSLLSYDDWRCLRPQYAGAREVCLRVLPEMILAVVGRSDGQGRTSIFRIQPEKGYEEYQAEGLSEAAQRDRFVTLAQWLKSPEEIDLNQNQITLSIV